MDEGWAVDKGSVAVAVAVVVVRASFARSSASEYSAKEHQSEKLMEPVIYQPKGLIPCQETRPQLPRCSARDHHRLGRAASFEERRGLPVPMPMALPHTGRLRGKDMGLRILYAAFRPETAPRAASVFQSRQGARCRWLNVATSCGSGQGVRSCSRRMQVASREHLFISCALRYLLLGPQAAFERLLDCVFSQFGQRLFIHVCSSSELSIAKW